MHGLMSERPLLISAIIKHAARYHGDTEIVSRTVDGTIHRYTYAEAERRSRRLARALLRLGIEPGDRVGTLAWNTYRHFELYYGDLGHRRGVPHDQPAAVRRADRLHRQPRRGPAAVRRDELHPAGRAAGAAIARRIAASCCCERGAETAPAAALARYDELIAAESEDFDWPEFDERTRRVAVLHLGHHRQARRARSTATARPCCMPMALSLPDAIPMSAATRSARWCRCFTPAAGASPIPRR